MSPSLTTAEPERLAAVISVAGHKVVHQYLVAHPASGSVVELALWSTLPAQVPWPAVSDDQVARFRACGWNASAIDGHDPEAIAKAIESAHRSDKPSLIACPPGGKRSS